MKSIVVLAITAIVLCSCSASITPVATPGGSETPAVMRDVTDTSTCTGAPFGNISIYNTWHVHYVSDNDLSMDMAFSIGSNSTTVTNTCYYPDGQSLGVSVTVASYLNG